MSYLKSICEALESQRHRYLSGVDRGIAKAIAARETPKPDDWEWLAKITTAALMQEAAIYAEGAESDRKHQAWAEKLAQQSTTQLQNRLAQLSGKSAGPEVLDSGTRSTSKATRNEGARAAYPEIRAIESALAIKEAAS